MVLLLQPRLLLLQVLHHNQQLAKLLVLQPQLQLVLAQPALLHNQLLAKLQAQLLLLLPAHQLLALLLLVQLLVQPLLQALLLVLLHQQAQLVLLQAKLQVPLQRLAKLPHQAPAQLQRLQATLVAT